MVITIDYSRCVSLKVGRLIITQERLQVVKISKSWYQQSNFPGLELSKYFVETVLDSLRLTVSSNV